MPNVLKDENRDRDSKKKKKKHKIELILWEENKNQDYFLLDRKLRIISKSKNQDQLVLSKKSKLIETPISKSYSKASKYVVKAYFDVYSFFLDKIDVTLRFH